VRKVKNATPDDLELALEHLHREFEKEREQAKPRRTTGENKSEEDSSIPETTNQ
jgi:hypothetical protein